MLSGVHSGTFENLQLNAGVFIFNFDHSDLATAKDVKDAVSELLEDSDESILGMTQGGGTYQCTPAIRHIEGDGLRTPVVGSTVNDGWTVKLTGTMKEITPGNFKRAFISADYKTEGEKTIIKVRTDILPDDYIEKLTWIGDTSRGLAMIELENVLNIVGSTFTFTDKGEGTMPFEFLAHAEKPINQEFAPCSVIFLNEAPAAAAANTTDQTQPAAAAANTTE